MADSSHSPGSATIDADLSGRDLGGYRILRRLGRGGMAEVYLAEQQSLRRQVAVKVLKASLAVDDKYVRRFHIEAQAAASLVHANIVQIHEVGCIEGLHYIAQEYVPGLNLRERLAREGTTDLRSALKIMRGVAAALHKAAEKGIVHRDIKPENIMLAKTGEVKVADFGLARLTRKDDLNLTQAGQTMGTPLYMSPEQIEGKPLDSRSDIYSLGITSYHMLTGNPPFRGETALSVAVNHLQKQPQRLENIRPDLPPAVCRIVHKMLAKDPQHRFANPRELLRELRTLRFEGLDDDPDEADDASFLADDTAPSQGLAEATQQLDKLMKTALVSRIARRRRWTWGTAVVLAFAAGAFWAWSMRPAYLLEGAGAAPSAVVRKNSASLQLLHANLLGTEEAYRAVIDYFGDAAKNDSYVHQAQCELAMIYLGRPEDRARALSLFAELARLGPNDGEFRAVGLAGQAIVYSQAGEHQQSYDIVAKELEPLLSQLSPQMPLDDRMRRLLEDACQQNDKKLNRKAWPMLEKLFQQGFGAAD